MGTSNLPHDEIFDQVVRRVIETGNASASMIQRQFKLGYARSARVLDELEQAGIIGPAIGIKPRKILFTKEQYESLKPEAILEKREHQHQVLFYQQIGKKILRVTLLLAICYLLKYFFGFELVIILLLVLILEHIYSLFT